MDIASPSMQTLSVPQDLQPEWEQLMAAVQARSLGLQLGGARHQRRQRQAACLHVIHQLRPVGLQRLRDAQGLHAGTGDVHGVGGWQGLVRTQHTGGGMPTGVS